jgi:hypothetical protein
MITYYTQLATIYDLANLLDSTNDSASRQGKRFGSIYCELVSAEESAFQVHIIDRTNQYPNIEKFICTLQQSAQKLLGIALTFKPTEDGTRWQSQVIGAI